MKKYKVTIEQVSKERNRSFNVFIDGQNVCELGIPLGLTEAENRSVELSEVVFEYAEHTVRRIIVHSFEDDVDVFARNKAEICFGIKQIKWAD